MAFEVPYSRSEVSMGINKADLDLALAKQTRLLMNEVQAVKTAMVSQLEMLRIDLVETKFAVNHLTTEIQKSKSNLETIEQNTEEEAVQACFKKHVCI